MERAYWKKKLRTIMARVEAGEAPARVREIYVFGSFARGALDPNDLDLIVVHDPPSPELYAAMLAAVESYSHDDINQHLRAELRFNAAMRRVFRRGSERMDVFTGRSFEDATWRVTKPPPGEVRLLWSEQDRDWEGKLAAIPLDPAAGSHPRHHFIEVKRAGCTLSEVEWTTQLIDDGVLTLDRLRIGEIEPELKIRFEQRLVRWSTAKIMGADALKVAPWALWWLQEQGAKEIDHPDRTDIEDKSGRFRVAIGRFHLAHMYASFRDRPRMKRQCLIPHLRVKQENWMYVFERGPNWRKDLVIHW